MEWMLALLFLADNPGDPAIPKWSGGHDLSLAWQLGSRILQLYSHRDGLPSYLLAILLGPNLLSTSRNREPFSDGIVRSNVDAI